MKSLITATFEVSFPQRWQGGALEWVKTSSSCKCWQAEGGLKLSAKSLEWWAGKQKAGVLSADLGHGFWLELTTGLVFRQKFSAVFGWGCSKEENNPWRIVWKSVTGGRACFPLQSGTLAGQSVPLELLLIFYLEAFYLKTWCINSSQLLKGEICTLSC